MQARGKDGEKVLFSTRDQYFSLVNIQLEIVLSYPVLSTFDYSLHLNQAYSWHWCREITKQLYS